MPESSGLAGLRVISTSTTNPGPGLDGADFLLTLVDEGHLTSAEHAALIDHWRGDYVDLPGGFRTLTTGQIVELTDAELLALGIGRALLRRLRAACEASASSIGEVLGLSQEQIQTRGGLRPRPPSSVELIQASLARGPRSFAELRGVVALPRTSLRRLLRRLEAEGVIIRQVGGPGKADAWTMPGDGDRGPAPRRLYA